MPFDPEHSLSDQQRTATSSAVTGASGCGAQTYQCPEERSPVSQAVHLGRLASGWSACRDCVWKDDVGDAVRLTATARAETEKHRGIRRTEFGVRGTYLNTIDRFRSAQLATIFSTQIVHQTTTTDIDGLSEDDDADVVSTTAKAAVAIGYDGRLGSPDLFAGVNSAVRQNGCNVVDAGRCTAASLLNVFRMNPGVRGAILVTGAGGSAGIPRSATIWAANRATSTASASAVVVLKTISGFPAPRISVAMATPVPVSRQGPGGSNPDS